MALCCRIRVLPASSNGGIARGGGGKLRPGSTMTDVGPPCAEELDSQLLDCILLVPLIDDATEVLGWSRS